MAKKHPKGKIVECKLVKRRKGYLYFVDGVGNVRESKMKPPRKRGPRKGKKACRIR